ncbi:GNAT family N-acetyltransferase [Frankia tisae]|uniref:GNAT family N-acetyltransferase n=1 Tax=Frankia tisae TaxID=2950104 RepID=UPI0021C11F6A|nr:N-acetyltransferase [Frankia tisae]
MMIRRETAGDVAAIRTVVGAAFARQVEPDRLPAEVILVDELRAGAAWIPALSLVATNAADDIVGHVLCTRATVGAAPVLALAPLGVRPDHQRRGVGHALMHAVLGAADALDEPLVGLLGDPVYYSRFGFRPADEGGGVIAPQPAWGAHFQVRTLTAGGPSPRGRFSYPEAFDRL